MGHRGDKTTLTRLTFRKSEKSTVVSVEKRDIKLVISFFIPMAIQMLRLVPLERLRNRPFSRRQDIGEIDDEGDEDEVPGLGLESDDEDDDIPVLQDGDSDMEWGEEALDWVEDDGAHELVPEGPKGEFGHPLPPFLGPQPDPHYDDYKDMAPKNPGQVFALFWHREIFEKMRKATNNFGRLYVKRFTKEITTVCEEVYQRNNILRVRSLLRFSDSSGLN
jgi:hypothetical protein